MPWDIAARLEKLKAERQAAEQAERDAKRATMRHRGYDENGEPESPAVVLARIRAAQRSGGNEGAALACDKYQVGINEVPADLSEEI